MRMTGPSGSAGMVRFEVGMAGAGVVDAAEPEAVAVALDGNVLVDEDGDAVAGESVDDQRRADGDVVVAEDGVAQGRGEAC